MLHENAIARFGAVEGPGALAADAAAGRCRRGQRSGAERAALGGRRGRSRHLSHPHRAQRQHQPRHAKSCRTPRNTARPSSVLRDNGGFGGRLPLYIVYFLS